MFEDFEEMFAFYTRRNIFNQHDWKMIRQEIVHDNDSFIEKIVRPKIYLGRLNYGDFLRIVAVL